MFYDLLWFTKPDKRIIPDHKYIYIIATAWENFHDMKREKINRKNAGKFKVKIAYVLNKYITTPKKDVLWEEHISQKDKNKTQKIYL